MEKSSKTNKIVSNAKKGREKEREKRVRAMPTNSHFEYFSRFTKSLRGRTYLAFGSAS